MATANKLLTLALSCIVTGCETSPEWGAFHNPATRQGRRQELRPQLKRITIEDGIDAAEANVIAQSYFVRFGPGCGAASVVTDGGASWNAATRVGYGAVPTREPIRVDKGMGRVTWSDGPTVTNPKKIW